MSKNEKRQIRILVKPFPQHSTKYEETVCCAGVTEDGPAFLRLFPIRFRRLPREHQFERFDLVEMTITKATDHRAESYRVDEDSIRLLEKGDKLSDASKVRLWKPFIAPSLTALMQDNKATGRSLGIIKPDPGSLKFRIKPATQSDKEDQKVADMVLRLQQTSLLEEPLKPLKKSEHSFSYEYTSHGHPHRHQIHDWEVQAAYINYRKRYGNDVLKMLEQEYQKNIPARNLHFVMGTMAAHPQTFIMIGLLRTGLDPEELNMQGELF